MARKYDRYGLNRQFKRKPVSKRTPFPYKLPFLDDFSYASAIHRVDVASHDSEMEDGDYGSPIQPPYSQSRKRPKYELPAPKYGQYKADWKGTAMEIVKDGAFALSTLVGVAEAYEAAAAVTAVRASAAEAELKAAQRQASRFKVRGKIIDLANGGIKNAKKINRVFRSQKPKYRLMRWGAYKAWKSKRL